MARLRLVTATDPARLLRHAAAGFLANRPATPDEPFPSPPYLLALRQGGLRDDVIGFAAEAGVAGWFDPPLCTFQELPGWLGMSDTPALGDQERRVLLGNVVRSAGREVFSRLDRPGDFLGAVDALFGELVAEAVAPDALAKALASREERDGFEVRRDADLAAAYAHYHEELARLGKADGRDAWSRCARAVRADAAALSRALGGRREIRIFGLADLRGGWRLLLDALAACPALDDVVVYSATRLPIDADREALDEPASAATRLFAAAGAPFPGAVTIVAAPDVERELDETARRIRHLVAHEGVAPHRIAVVSRKARPHVDLAVASLEKFGVPAIARRRVGLAEIPSVRAVRAMFGAAAGGWSRAGLTELARHPYIDCELDTRVLDVIGFRRRVLGLGAWERAIRELEVEAREREPRRGDGEESRGRALPPSNDVTATRECFGPFAARARALDARRTLHDWLAWLADFIEHDRCGVARRMSALPLERHDVLRRDLAGWDALRQVVDEWLAAVDAFGEAGAPVSVAEFDAQLRDVLAGDVALWTPKRRGVQVLEAMAAAYRSFDHVFLVGMEAGQFPAPAARSPILDDAEREALIVAGLPLDPAAVRDERERDLFRVLVAGATRTLTASYARMDANGGEVIRSAYADELADITACAEQVMPAHEVVVHGVPLALTEAAREQAVIGAAIEHERETGVASGYDGLISDAPLVEWLAREFGDDRRWSPSQLEELAKCPWSYFSRRLLGMERLADPGEDIEPTVRGTILHDALRRFFDAAPVSVTRPVFLRATDMAEWGDAALVTAVDDAFHALAGTWLGHPSLEKSKREEVLRIARGYVAWEVELHETMTDPKTKKRNAPKMIRTGVVAHEVAFDDLVYEHDGVRIRYRGSIDRVEVSEGVEDRFSGVRFVAAADYKTSKSATPGGGDAKAWSEGVVLQVPLYAYALTKLYPGHEVSRVEYLPLRKPGHVLQLQPWTYDKKAAAPASDDDAQDQWQAALQAAIAHVRRARAGEFPAAPPSTCGCPPWCHGKDVCRVKPEASR